MKSYLRLATLSLLLLFWMAPAIAQISQSGTPRSFNQSKSTLFNIKVPVAEMEYVDVEALRAEDALIDHYKDRPWRFGENLYVDFDVKSDGVETILPNGDKVYRLSIFSPGAVSINLTFDQYRLPAGADLFVYNSDGSDVIGAFTSQNNQDDGVFATSLIQGDQITIEYYEPAIVAFSGELHLYRVTHGYRGIYDFTKAFGSSGSCNVNVACPQSAGWENEINSVCMLVSGGSGFCTGSLVNNTANDGTPYVLTADHCYSTPSSWVFYFNWQSATCANGTNPPHDDITGAVLRARNAASDFCLVEMNSTPPASYGVYYSGWNRTTSSSLSGTVWGIHHPSADIKKISWSTLGVTTTSYLGTTSPGDNSHWRITSWSDLTTTEGGSSGSALFDSNHRIIGQLHGGYAACGNTDSDWYGKFGVSWTGGGTSATRLSNWLDPSTTGVTVLDGYDPNVPTITLDAQLSSITQPTGSSCGTTTITPTVILRNAGSTTLTSATVAYKIDNGSVVNFAWGGTLASGTTTTITFPSTTTSYGVHTIKSWSTLPNGGTDLNNANDTASTSFTLNSGTYSAPFVELFNGATFPPACWASYIGTNGLGTVNNWTSTTTTSEGTGAAYIAYENVSGGTAEDWLVTPLIQLSNSSTMTFYQRQTYSSSYNTSYSVRVSTASQTSQATFTTAATWLESTFTTAYTKKTIDLSAYDGQAVYVAFVMTQDDGDDWFVDSVKINGTCTAPVAAFSASTATPCANATVTFTDATTNTPTGWAWAISPATYTFVGGTNANSQNPQVQFTAADTYSITLTSTNGCGSDDEIKGSYLTVGAAPAQPSAILGDASPCQNTGSLVYSVTNVGGVTYNWSVPTGWSITNGSGTYSITVTSGTASGTISVTPNNGCDGTPQTLSVTTSTVPAAPSVITGQIGPCQSSTLDYSVTNEVGVTYTWTVPGDWTINSGQGTNQINVTVGASSGTVQVTPSNTCGNGTAASVSVTASVLPSQPSTITGDVTPCEGSSFIYSVTNVAGMTYSWSLPAGYAITAGTNTSAVTVDVTSGTGTISVTPSNGCGAGTAQTLSVASVAGPVVDLGADTTICDDQVVLLDASGSFASWAWSTGQSSSTISYDASVAGVGSHDVDVEVVDANGCSGYDTITINVVNCTNIEAASRLIASVFPNPVADFLTVEFTENLGSVKILMFDATGKQVLVQQGEASVGSAIQLQVSDLAKGIYSLQIISNKDVQFNSVIKL